MILNDIYRNFKRSRLFTIIKIVGLSIGLAVSIMLVVFVLNELSFDKHFKDSDYIISLNIVMETNGVKSRIPISTRKAITDIPQKVPGIEAYTQIYSGGDAKASVNNQHYSNFRYHETEASFFNVFDSQFIEGNKYQLDKPNTAIVASHFADIVFGSALFCMLSLNVFRWILIACVIAIPLVYYITTQWLDNYANKAPFRIWIFVLPMFIKLIIALITTSGVTISVLLKNPVESLKSE